MTQKEIFKSENLEINIEDLENISGGMPGSANFVRSPSGTRIATVRSDLSPNRANLANIMIRAANDGSASARHTTNSIFNGEQSSLLKISRVSSSQGNQGTSKRPRTS